MSIFNLHRYLFFYIWTKEKKPQITKLFLKIVTLLFIAVRNAVLILESWLQTLC